MKNPFAWALVSLCAFCVSATADVISISNPSFESPVLNCTPGPGCFDLDTFNGWSFGAGSTATFRPSVGAGQEFTSLPDGAQVAAISDDLNDGGEIFQDLPATLGADTTYTLTFWVGQRADIPFDPSYVVSLMANGVVLGSNSGASPAAGAFVQQTISFTTGDSPAELGKTLRIDVSAPFNSPGQADFDLFALTTSASTSAVPEPGLLGFVSVGMLGLLAAARKYRLR